MEEAKDLKWSSPLTADKVDDLWDVEPEDIYAVDIVHGLRQNRFSYQTQVPMNLLKHPGEGSNYLGEQ